VEKEMQIYRAQAREMGKPQAAWEKIASGKLEKYYQDTCLLEQPFIKDPNLKIADLLGQKIAKIGENITVRRFTRYQLGEEE
jgi:elongation factor Ts